MYDPCINCKGLSFKIKYCLSKSNRNIAICQDCSLVQVNPRDNLLNFIDNELSINRDDKLHRLFDLMTRNTAVPLKEIMGKEYLAKKRGFEFKIKEINRYKKSGKLLDIGCAEGIFLSACSEHGFDCYGIEPSKYTYSIATKILPSSKIHNTTLSEAEFPQSYFDIVTMINTIEHTLNPKGIIEEAYRILSPGGVLMIETPDIGHWLAGLMGKKWLPLLVPDHIIFFSKKTIINMLRESGFVIQSIRSSFKVISVRLLLFHLNRMFTYSNFLSKICEKTRLADKVVRIPQWDEMILFAIKS